MAKPVGTVYIPAERGELQAITVCVDEYKSTPAATDKDVALLFPTKNVRLVKAWVWLVDALDTSGAASYIYLETDDGSTETQIAKLTLNANDAAGSKFEIPFIKDPFIKGGTQWLQARIDINVSANYRLMIGIEFYTIEP